MVKCPVVSVSIPAMTKLHRSIRTTGAMVVLNSTTVVLQVISDFMFSVTTLPMHCFSTVFTDVTSLNSSPTLVTLLAKKTHISQYYCWYVSLQCYETEIQRRCEVHYIPQCYNKMYWQSHQTEKEFDITYEDFFQVTKLMYTSYIL